MLRAFGFAVALLAVLAWLALAPRALSATPASDQVAGSSQAKPTISVQLEQCVTSSEQAERSATFSGEMTAVPGTAKMEMRIDVLERQPGEMAFHAITAAGLGAWRDPPNCAPRDASRRSPPSKNRSPSRARRSPAEAGRPGPAGAR